MKTRAAQATLSGLLGLDAPEPPTVDPRNTLNELTGRKWVIETKSVWYCTAPRRDALKAQHPATYAEADVERLLRFFTKRGMSVLDPFCGAGSTLVACLATGRHGLGIELSERWGALTRERLEAAGVGDREPWGVCGEGPPVSLVVGDTREVLPSIEPDQFDFVVTSPPYWGILNKPPDHKTKRERVTKGLATRYSKDPRDLANIEKYPEFLGHLGGIFSECLRVLRRGKYMAVVVSDFRHKGKHYLFHADLAAVCEELGFVLKGQVVLVQDHKTLYPYGYPYAYVSNVHHQNIVIFQKERLP